MQLTDNPKVKASFPRNPIIDDANIRNKILQKRKRNNILVQQQRLPTNLQRFHLTFNVQKPRHLRKQGWQSKILRQIRHVALILINKKTNEILQHHNVNHPINLQQANQLIGQQVK